jgi:NAD(P)-dependent dehydrogenase (short-subunit alcohol dehydrogenase family)
MVVTGGNRVIGATTARLAAANGYAVCICYLSNEAAASAVVHDISEAVACLPPWVA